MNLFKMLSPKPQTNKILTLADKISAIKEVEKEIKKKSDIAKEFGIPPNKLSTYLKNKEKTVGGESECGKEQKRLRAPENPSGRVCSYCRQLFLKS